MPDQTPETRTSVDTDALATAMQSLYAAAPDAFMATRSALVAEAKAAGDGSAAEIGKLRKPSLAAWAVNLTARSAPDVVAALTDLGAQMRSAQSRLDTAALSAMRGERDTAVDAFVRAAVETVSEAGRTLSAAAQQDVRSTAIAALADERASAAVTSGQLTRALSYSGFGEVDLDEAVARTTGGAILTILPGGRGRRPGGGSGTADTDSDDGSAGGHGGDRDDGDDGDDAENDEAPSAEDLEEALASAEQAFAAAQAAVDAARQRAEDTRERLAVVERQLTKAREADERALEAVTDAVRARKKAEATRHTAQAALDDARGRD
jgi:hypothetical protein